MDNPLELGDRKADHIRINLEEDVHSGQTTGLERYRFINEALPDLDLSSIDTKVIFLGKSLNAPLLVSSMTGGTQEAERINMRLAESAQQFNVAMGLGSQRTAIEDPAVMKTFQVRKAAPDILLFANLGAVQLNYGYSVDHCRRAVESVGANGIFLHINALQEALQPEGNTRFSGLLQRIEEICRVLDVPVIVKEVGWGISARTAQLLVNAGVAAVDVAGAGGTSWSQVEMYRMKDPHRAAIAGAFRDWGIPTAKALKEIHAVLPDLSLIASGGLRTGVEIAKTITLGATLAGMAGPFLKAAARSQESVLTLMDVVISQLRIAMFAAGARNLSELQKLRLVED